MMVCFSSPDVGGNHSCCSSINHNGYFVFFFGVRLPKIFSDCFSKGNLLGSLIEPETSTKKTKKLADYPLEYFAL
jgi:hypothetical protein